MFQPCNCQCEVSSCLMTLMVPHTLYRIGTSWSPLCLIRNRNCMVPHMYNMISSSQLIWSPTCMYDPPFFIWNSYLMVPPTLYGTGIVWSPPNVRMVPHTYDMIYSGQLRKNPLRVLIINLQILSSRHPLVSVLISSENPQVTRVWWGENKVKKCER